MPITQRPHGRVPIDHKALLTLSKTRVAAMIKRFGLTPAPPTWITYITATDADGALEPVKLCAFAFGESTGHAFNFARRCAQDVLRFEGHSTGDVVITTDAILHLAVTSLDQFNSHSPIQPDQYLADRGTTPALIGSSDKTYSVDKELA